MKRLVGHSRIVGRAHRRADQPGEQPDQQQGMKDQIGRLAERRDEAGADGGASGDAVRGEEEEQCKQESDYDPFLARLR